LETKRIESRNRTSAIIMKNIIGNGFWLVVALMVGIPSVSCLGAKNEEGNPRQLIISALKLVESGASVKELIAKAGKPDGFGSDVPFCGPVYKDDSGSFLFAPLEPYGGGYRETDGTKIGMVIYFAVIGEIHMPPVYVYPLKLRGQIAVPPKSPDGP